MREAFSLLIDRDYIVENVGQSGQVPANSFIPLGMADGNGGVFKSSVEDEGYFDVYGINNDYEGTLKKARTLLKAAGYKFGDDGMLSDETPFSLRTGTSSSRSARTATMTSAVKAGSPTSTNPSTCLRCGSPTPATTTASMAALANM